MTRWLVANGERPGAALTGDKLSALAHAWWGNRLSPDWLPRSRDESQAILEWLGLTGDYWRLD